MTKKPTRSIASNKPTKSIVNVATDTSLLKKEKNPAAVALGKLGGLKGGKARAAKLTPEQRSEIAKKAAKSRWKKDL